MSVILERIVMWTLLLVLLLGIVTSAQEQQCVTEEPLVFEMLMDGTTRNCRCELQAPKQCSKLDKAEGASWDPVNCTELSSDIGAICTIHCEGQYELRGSQLVQCTPDGWNGTAGVGVQPQCLTEEEVSQEMFKEMNATISGAPNGLLFMMDQSTSVNAEQFEVEKKFVEALLNAFPLSENRSAGLISFSTKAKVHIKLSTSDHCGFLSSVKRIPKKEGWTNMDRALRKAKKEISSNRIHNLTLVVFITDGNWTGGDPTEDVNALKNDQTILLTVGVADYVRGQLEAMASRTKEGTPLFYGISDFNAFNSIADYLQRTFGGGAPNCDDRQNQ